MFVSGKRKRGNRLPEAKEHMCVPGALGRTEYLHLSETLRWRSVVFKESKQAANTEVA